MSEFLIGVVAAALVNVRTLDGAPESETPERLKRAAMLGGLTAFVTLKACGVAYVLHYGVLSPLGLGAAWIPLCFLVTFASAWAFGRLARNGAGTFAAFAETYWPLVALNAAVFGAASHGLATGAGFLGNILTALAASALFAVTLAALTAIEARMDDDALPESVRGFPSLLLAAALISMALMAFAGL